MDVNTAARKGRFGDTTLAHVTPGERVIPPRELFPEEVNDQIDASLEALGLNPDRYEVGSDASSINPETGLPEYQLGNVIASQAAKEGVKAGGNILGQWLADKRSRKAQKRAERKAGEVLGGLDLSSGFFESPFASGQFGRQGSGVGGGYTFSPEMQGLWESGLGRANTLGNLYGQYVTPDYFTEGTIFDLFNESRIGRVQRGEDAAANAISQLLIQVVCTQLAGWICPRYKPTLMQLKRQKMLNKCSICKSF